MSNPFNQLRQKWWWLDDEAAFEMFCDCPAAQGYEVFRRNPEMAPAIDRGAQGRPPRPWNRLNASEHKAFVALWKGPLAHWGFLKSGVQLGPRCISFDCRYSNHHLIEALDLAVRYELPYAMLGETGEAFGPKLDIRPDGEDRIHIAKSEIQWTCGPLIFGAVSLCLPERPRYNQGRDLYWQEIKSRFASFIRRPPPAFREFRDKAKELKVEELKVEEVDSPRIKPPRKLQGDQIAAGLIAFDCEKNGARSLRELADWLTTGANGPGFRPFGKSSASARYKMTRAKPLVVEIINTCERKPRALGEWCKFSVQSPV